MTGDDIPYVRAFRGMIADYYDGVIDDEGMMNAMGLLARDDVATSLGMGVADSGERPLSDVLLDGVPGSDKPVEGDPTPIDPGRARRLILKLTGKEAQGE